jgi:hypothetical protein
MELDSLFLFQKWLVGKLTNKSYISPRSRFYFEKEEEPMSGRRVRWFYRLFSEYLFPSSVAYGLQIYYYFKTCI